MNRSMNRYLRFDNARPWWATRWTTGDDFRKGLVAGVGAGAAIAVAAAGWWLLKQWNRPSVDDTARRQPVENWENEGGALATPTVHAEGRVPF